MKKRIIFLAAISLAVGSIVTSCDVDAKFETEIPVHALVKMVRAATATVGEETVNGIVDNENHTVSFVFNEAKDYTAVTVNMVYSSRAVLKEGAVNEFTADLSKGHSYTMVINNEEEDFTYTVTASRASVAQIDRTNCSVVLGLENDANPVSIQKTGSGDYLFDGQWMTKKEDYRSIGWHCFGWMMDDSTLKGANGEVYGDAYTIDVGEPVRIAKMQFLPYRQYTENCAAQFEIYAYSQNGKPIGEWSSWTLIGTVDDSAKWLEIKDLEAGAEHPYLTDGTIVNFNYSDVPVAQYYRVKILKNFYAYYQGKINSYWNQRLHWYDIAELQLWKYNLDE